MAPAMGLGSKIHVLDARPRREDFAQCMPSKVRSPEPPAPNGGSDDVSASDDTARNDQRSTARDTGDNHRRMRTRMTCRVDNGARRCYRTASGADQTTEPETKTHWIRPVYRQPSLGTHVSGRSRYIPTMPCTFNTKSVEKCGWPTIGRAGNRGRHRRYSCRRDLRSLFLELAQVARRAQAWPGTRSGG
jgi:hypothetical protein